MNEVIGNIILLLIGIVVSVWALVYFSPTVQDMPSALSNILLYIVIAMGALILGEELGLLLMMAGVGHA